MGGSGLFSSFGNPLTDIQFRRCDARREREAPASAPGSFKCSGSFSSTAGGSRRQSRLSRPGSFVGGAGDVWWSPSGTLSGHIRPSGSSGMRTITSTQHLLPAMLEDLEG